MDPSLNPVEIRALGSLIEKQIATPEYYPLTLSALVNACNQTTNRDPVTSYDETTVGSVLERLRQEGLVWTVTNSRVPKYGNRFNEKYRLDGRQVAVMCVLMLRGAQTAGEIRGRTGRLHEFATLEEVDHVLGSLTSAEPPLAMKLPRLPGTKEPRFVHLLGGNDPADSREAPPRSEPAATDFRAENERIAQLENQVEALRHELHELRRQLVDLTKQLE